MLAYKKGIRAEIMFWRWFSGASVRRTGDRAARADG
jgi:hypothetical protein